MTKRTRNSTFNNFCSLYASNILSGRKQDGSILLVCLIFLLVLTMMALSGMETTILEERMAGNLQQQSRVFLAAEASLHTAEKWLRKQSSQPPLSGNGDENKSVWSRDSAGESGDTEHWWLQRDANWWRSNAVILPARLAHDIQTQYIIEQYFEGDSGEGLNIGDGSTKSKHIIHRVTASAWERNGGQENIQVQLQTTHMWTYN